MSSNNNKELASTIRNQILRILRLWASKEEQLGFMQKVPFAQHSAELFQEWFDFYHPGNEVFNISFNEKERIILNDFNARLEQANRSLNENYPSIRQFITTKEWQEIHEAAKRAISKLG